MAKRSMNETVFGVHGINPSFSGREERNSSSKTTGKVVLKRQQLLTCPFLQVDEQIKLLNLQKNCIVKISNIDHLTSLVVLDLCENEIDSIQGVDTLVSLRILRLGNNKIRQIKNLDALKELDVLDLNGNQISRIENLKQLAALRVLNLSFNRIEKCENLQHLKKLAELNLQGNLINSAIDLESLPIQRLNLSANKIRRFDDIRCISKLMALEWLSLEGNPLPFSTAYEQIVLTQSQSTTATTLKPEHRSTIHREQKFNRALKMHTNQSDNNSSQRERRSLDNTIQHQDSMSERSDTEFDTTQSLTKISNQSNRTTTFNQQKSQTKVLHDNINPLFSEPKINPAAQERSILAKSLVQSAIDQAFQKEQFLIQFHRFCPIFLVHSTIK